MAKNFTMDIRRFAGLNASAENTENLLDGESPDMVNFSITSDYQLKKREGYTVSFSGEKPIRGIYYTMMGDKTCYLAVEGDKLLYSGEDFSSLRCVFEGVPGEDKVTFFPFARKVYILTGNGVVEFDGEKGCIPEPYIPTVMISTNPDGSGVLYEEVNLLTRKVKQLFSGDGTSFKFKPVITEINRIDYVLVGGKELGEEDYLWDESSYTFNFGSVPKRGIDNIEIQYEIDSPDLAATILNCRGATAFGGASDTRAFVYGNPENPSVRYHSGVVDGKPTFTYFPETAVSLVGSGEAITSILCHYDRQLIFTTTSAYYSYLEYMSGVDGNLIAAFPVFPLNDERGNRPFGQALLLENTPYTLTDDGLVQWITTNIRDERNAQIVSEPIDYFLRKEKPEKAILFNRKETSELYLSIDEHCYVYNYRLKLFYYYELLKPEGFMQGENDFYFYNENCIYKVGGDLDREATIVARWRSKLFDFSKGNLQKKLFGLTLYLKQRRGGGVNVRIREDRGLWSAPCHLSGPSTEEGVKRRFPVKKRRFRLLEIEIQSTDGYPVSIYGLSMKGRITDRED